MKRNLIIIGLGPHAQACQYYFLETMYRKGMPIRVRLLVELQDRAEDVENFLQNKSLQPDQLFGLPVEDRNSPTIHPKLLEFVEKIKHTVDGVLVCTEPKAHKKYILWALQNNIDVLSDKPLTAPLINEQGFEQVWQDYQDIETALSKSKARLCLLTNKRVHKAYQEVYNQVRDFVTQYQMPITQIEMSEGGGVWAFPTEFESRENHPYKYGYGVLLHTGFHYVDLVLHYQSINHLIGLQEDKINVHAFGSTPYDAVHQISQKVYEKMFPKENFSSVFASLPLEKYKQYGIVDLLSTLQFEKDGAVITQATLNMLQNTLSSRCKSQTPQNPYLQLGRLTQNYISVSCGPLFNVKLSFFQPDKVPDGTYDTYIVETLRNTALVGGKSYERKEFEDKILITPTQYNSLNMSSKFYILDQWMNDTCQETDFSLHKRSAWLTTRLFEEIFTRREERWGKSRK